MERGDKWLEMVDRILKIAAIAIAARELLRGLSMHEQRPRPGAQGRFSWLALPLKHPRPQYSLLSIVSTIRARGSSMIVPWTRSHSIRSPARNASASPGLSNSRSTMA